MLRFAVSTFFATTVYVIGKQLEIRILNALHFLPLTDDLTQHNGLLQFGRMFQLSVSTSTQTLQDSTATQICMHGTTPYLATQFTRFYVA